jgi:hypothetical protein
MSDSPTPKPERDIPAPFIVQGLMGIMVILKQEKPKQKYLHANKNVLCSIQEEFERLR